ncbi:MAG: uroporphyrinogen decarboxylase family protein [Anaerolineae bacterium]
MTNAISTLLDDIERLYPPGRIAASRRRLKAVWWGHEKPDRQPFVFNHLPPEDITTTADPAVDAVPPPPPSAEDALRGQLEAIITRAVIRDDYIPSLFPGIRQGLLTTAYGAHEVQTGGHTWVEPILHSPADVDALPQPDFTRQGVAAEYLETIRYWRSATGGRISIQMPDMQGPLDLANNLWGTEGFLLAMQEAPAAAHKLLARMAADFIRYMCLVREAAQGDWVPLHCMPIVWLPPMLGVALSEDLLAITSPRLYREFGVPYNQRIADAFGGVVIHSCGSVEHNLPALAAMRGLIGLNVSITETSLEAAIRGIGSQRVLLAHHAALNCNDLPHLTPEQYLYAALPTLKKSHWRSIAIPIPLELNRQQTLELVPLAERLAGN